MATAAAPATTMLPHQQGPVHAARPEHHVLTVLVRRLEAATSRLEDIASSALDGEQQPKANGVPTSSTGAAAAGPTSQMVTPTPSVSAPSGQAAAPPKEELPQMIEDFDVLINGDLKAYHELSKGSSIGGLLGEQVRHRI